MADYPQHAVKLPTANQHCMSFRGGHEIAYYCLIAETGVISHDRISMRPTLSTLSFGGRFNNGRSTSSLICPIGSSLRGTAARLLQAKTLHEIPPSFMHAPRVKYFSTRTLLDSRFRSCLESERWNALSCVQGKQCCTPLQTSSLDRLVQCDRKHSLTREMLIHARRLVEQLTMMIPSLSKCSITRVSVQSLLKTLTSTHIYPLLYLYWPHSNLLGTLPRNAVCILDLLFKTTRYMC